MKTMSKILDALYQVFRSWAAQNGWTIKVVLEESLRQFLEARRSGPSSAAPKWRAVVFGGQGLQVPGMTFSEMLALAERPFPNTEPRVKQ